MTGKTRRILMVSSTLVLGILLVAGVLSFSASTAQAERVNWIINSNFEDGVSWPWTTSETWPGHVEGNVRDQDGDGDKEFCVLIDNTGEQKWDVQTRYRRLEIKEGRHYTGHYTVFADRNVTIDMKIAESHPPYAAHLSVSGVAVTTVPQTFEFEFDGARVLDSATGEMMEDTAAEFAFHLGASGNQGATICFDDVYFTDGGNHELPDPQKTSTIRVNHQGYFVNGPKIASVALNYARREDQYLVWGILTNVDGREVNLCPGGCGRTEIYTAGGHADGYDPASGEYILLIDFTAKARELELQPGRYRLVAIAPRTSSPDYSEYFTITDDLYTHMKTSALSYFYQNRSGTPILEEYVGNFLARGAGHDQTPDINTDQPFDGSVKCFSGDAKDGTTWKNCIREDQPPMFTDDYRVNGLGGWYDAGDHGKYVVNGGISVWTLLNLYEHNPASYSDGTLRLPKNANGVPDILDEARWELEFMLNMQVPPEGADYQVPEGGVSASGLVHHMLHDTQWTDIPYRADEVLGGLNGRKDYGTRAVYPPSTAATLNLAAVAAQCARIWEYIDPGFASRCRIAASQAWEAANAHPNLYATSVATADALFNGGGPYNDDDVSDEFYWAAAEMYATTGDSSYLTSEHVDQALIGQIMTELGREGSGSMTWKDTAALGTISLAMVDTDRISPDIQSNARANIMAAADVFVNNTLTEGHGTPYKPGPTGDYAWGSNSFVLNEMIVMGLARDFAPDGDAKTRYLNGMISGMDYLFGRNAMGMSYVSLVRETSFHRYDDEATDLNNPHHRHWAWQAWPRDDIRYPIPPEGVIAGGPNSSFRALADPKVGNKATIAMGLWESCRNTPQKCYVDDIDAWAVNEVTINWNAPFAWVLTYLDENRPRPDLPLILDVDIDFGVRDNPGWLDGFTVDLTLTNNSDQPVDDWILTFTFPGNQQIYEAWGIDYIQDGAAVTIQSSADWTAVIEPGQSITFGFNAHYSGENGIPTDFEVTAGSSSDPDPDPNPNLTVQLTPNGDVCKNILVTNNGSEPVDWVATFEFDQPIGNLWNAVWSQNGNVVTIEGVDWNNILQPGETTHSIGFCPANDTTPEPTPVPTLFPTLMPTAGPNLTVQLTPNGDVCKNILVTNNGSQAVDWVATFRFNRPIDNLWNAIWSQNGNVVTIEGVDWNNILQPGETTHSIGFCPRQ
ncbi:MAG: glycoside hydrolase family 9 protein [Anaerolineae bacterium]|nr:glycoside hydrolase family 9 protein [Anaerolineae bacterium]